MCDCDRVGGSLGMHGTKKNSDPLDIKDYPAIIYKQDKFCKFIKNYSSLLINSILITKFELTEMHCCCVAITHTTVFHMRHG